ncbi:MAG: CoA pyrophosphatase [Hyphomicrobiales bacterium]|nr:CoA pyrophosphatase [Hyphomicrobiales bacterium]
MTISIDAAGREKLVERFGAFPRLPTPPGVERLKHAAVAIVVVDGEEADDPSLLLTRRSPNLRTHAAQWALPGGRCDAGETPAQAALRELQEEIALALAPEAVLGLLDDYVTRSGYVITPVVIWGGRVAGLVPNPGEVESIHRLPIAQIAAEDAAEFVSIPESDRPVIRLRIWRNTIHAPTAAVLYQFREALAGRVTRVAEMEQPVFAWR